MYGYGYTFLGSIGMGGTSLDPDAAAFLTAAGITNPTQQGAINTLVLSLKADGIWSKMSAIYPFVGGTAFSHKFNLKNPLDTNAAFRLSFLGGWTHSNTGALPNGTNGYADTFLVPSVITILNNESLGFQLRTNNAALSADPVDMGTLMSSLNGSTLVSSTSIGTRLNGNLLSIPQATTIGLACSSKFSATLTKIYKNGSVIATGNSGGTLSNLPIYIGTLNLFGTAYASGYTRNQFTFCFYGQTLTDADNINLNNIVNAYNTTLGR